MPACLIPNACVQGADNSIGSYSFGSGGDGGGNSKRS
jgi:hypothetical protein